MTFANDLSLRYAIRNKERTREKNVMTIKKKKKRKIGSSKELYSFAQYYTY